MVNKKPTDNFVPIEGESRTERGNNIGTFAVSCQEGNVNECVTEQELAAALAIARGTCRYLRALGCAVIDELCLADGRRCDLIALDPRGEISIVEIKSCLNDFRTDQKWPDYRQWCDRFYFAVDMAFPQAVIPEDCGLLIADRFDAELLRDAPEHRLSAARRKAVTLRFARAAALRLAGASDPLPW